MKVIYYVASSLDGYIATPEGGVEWLEPFQGRGEDYGFGEFFSSIDALLMGSRTYEFALAHPPWMAPGKQSWVFTSRDLPRAHPSVTLTTMSPPRVVEELAAQGLQNAWLMGGGELAASLRASGLIDRYIIAFIPVLLGSGIPLFAAGGDLEPLELVSTKRFGGGVVQLTYGSQGNATGDAHRAGGDRARLILAPRQV
jgi:dihydrofolate reductase